MTKFPYFCWLFWNILRCENCTFTGNGVVTVCMDENLLGYVKNWCHSCLPVLKTGFGCEVCLVMSVKVLFLDEVMQTTHKSYKVYNQYLIRSWCEKAQRFESMKIWILYFSNSNQSLLTAETALLTMLIFQFQQWIFHMASLYNFVVTIGQ